MLCSTFCAFALTLHFLSINFPFEKNLFELLDYFGIKHDSWEQVVTETQEKWLRQEGKELWEVEKKQDCNPEKTYCLFSKINMTQEILPQKNCYDYAIILGATLGIMRERFYALKVLWDQGLHFNKLIVLVGDRRRDPQLEDLKALTTSKFPFREGWQFSGAIPKNETELAMLAFEQLDLPSYWNNITTFDDTPLKEGQKRPTTADTFNHWQLCHPKAGSCLIFSSQPFIQRQNLTAQIILGQDFAIETVGKGISWEEYKSHPQALAIMLDELARLIYLRNYIEAS